MEPTKEESKKELFIALSKAQSAINAAGKSKENKFDHYMYSTLEDYWKSVQKPMADNGLSFPVTISAIERLEKRTTQKGGTEYVVQVQLTGILCHESGQSMEFTCYGEGQDRSDKAIYKAVTGGKKYLLASVFNIPTTDDPEKDSDEERGGTQQPPAQQKQPPKTTPAQQAAQRQAQTPPQDADVKLIGQEQYTEIITKVTELKIPKAKWMSFLKKEFKVSGAAGLSIEQYAKVMKILKENPAVVDPGPNF